MFLGTTVMELQLFSEVKNGEVLSCATWEVEESQNGEPSSQFTVLDENLHGSMSPQT